MKLAFILMLPLAFVRSTSERTWFTSGDRRTHYHDFVNTHATRYNDKINEESYADYWNRNARSTVIEKLHTMKNTGIARNVIFFLGDGMSVATLTAARIHLGQRNGKTGEETSLSFEKFPYTGLTKTYCVDEQVADSACTATAYLSGVKANVGTIGVTAAVELSDCDGMNVERNHVFSIAHSAQLVNKRTGFVTTTRVTHASPAGIYAHTAHRDWESDVDVEKQGKDPNKCLDIARQLIEGDTGRKLNVIFGGGKYNFLPKELKDEDQNFGHRNDRRNLINDWKNSKKNSSTKYVYNLDGLKNVSGDVEYVLGLFDSDHMQYNLDRDKDKTPSLQQMTEKAIEILSQGNEGYFLFVEGGRIDHAHHGTYAQKALDETIEFHKAVEAAVKITNWKDTLIVVTSDHSHTMTINGYSKRGSDILGIGGNGSDNLPYATLSYANGPSAAINKSRENIKDHNFADKDYKHPSFVHLKMSTHAGEDVPIFARGPWAHLFTGVYEQNVIPHLINYAFCLGDLTACSYKSSSTRTVDFMALNTILFCSFIGRKSLPIL